MSEVQTLEAVIAAVERAGRNWAVQRAEGRYLAMVVKVPAGRDDGDPGAVCDEAETPAAALRKAAEAGGVPL